MNFKDIVPYTKSGSYQVNSPWDHFEEHYMNRTNGPVLDTNPDYQRDHVWTPEQESRWVEHCLRGGIQGKDIYLNCPGWMSNFRGPFEVVDGKQRIKAALGFIHDKVKAFGFYCSEFESNYVGHVPHDKCEFIIYINDLPRREMVLQWYIDLNAGGTVHKPEEIEKVRKLLEEERSNK